MIHFMALEAYTIFLVENCMYSGTMAFGMLKYNYDKI